MNEEKQQKSFTEGFSQSKEPSLSDFEKENVELKEETEVAEALLPSRFSTEGTFETQTSKPRDIRRPSKSSPKSPCSDPSSGERRFYLTLAAIVIGAPTIAVVFSIFFTDPFVPLFFSAFPYVGMPAMILAFASMVALALYTNTNRVFRSFTHSPKPLRFSVSMLFTRLIIISCLVLLPYFAVWSYLGVLVSKASELCELKDYQGAIPYYTKLVSAYSFLPAFNIERGNCYLKTGQYQLAVDDFTQTIKKFPDVGSYFARARAYEKLGAMSMAQRDREAATALVKKEGYATAAQSAYDSKQFEEAAKLYSHSIAANPKAAKNYVLRGKCYYNLDQFDQALADYNKAVSLYPGFGQAFYERAKDYAKLGKQEAAKSDHLKAKELGYKPE